MTTDLIAGKEREKMTGINTAGPNAAGIATKEVAPDIDTSLRNAAGIANQNIMAT